MLGARRGRRKPKEPGWPREGRSREESWAATATLAAARGKERTRGRDAKRCEPGGGGAPTKGRDGSSLLRGERPDSRASASAAGQWLRPPRPPSPDPSQAPARPRSHTHRARAATARPPAALSRSPPRPPRPASGLGPGGGAGAGQGRGYVTGACALCAPATVRADRYLRGSVVSLENRDKTTAAGPPEKPGCRLRGRTKRKGRAKTKAKIKTRRRSKGKPRGGPCSRACPPGILRRRPTGALFPLPYRTLPSLSQTLRRTAPMLRNPPKACHTPHCFN